MPKEAVKKISARCIPFVVLLGLLMVPLVGGNIGTAMGGDRDCTISHISVLEDRIHVKCSTPEPNLPAFFTVVYFYAASTANAGNANRMLALLNTAYTLGKIVHISYDSSSANNPSGCLATDCRKLTGVLLVP